MSTRFLKYFFEPESLAVIGASEKNFSLGGQVVANLKDAEFPGKVWVVNPKKYAQVHGCDVYHSIQKLPEVPDLAVVCTPAAAAPGVVE